MKGIDKIFANNRRWAADIKRGDPEFFYRLRKQQHPEYLWIGCADSRVPANQIIDLPPGEVFVHRNIANVVVHTDLNALSVIQFAVEVLKVKHILVCGHYGCGGIRAALEDEDHGLIDNWLRHIKDVYRFHAEELDALADMNAKVHRLCELNVIEQVKNILNTTIVKHAMTERDDLAVHGVIYDLQDGLLRYLYPEQPESSG